VLSSDKDPVIIFKYLMQYYVLVWPELGRISPIVTPTIQGKSLLRLLLCIYISLFLICTIKKNKTIEKCTFTRYKYPICKTITLNQIILESIATNFCDTFLRYYS